MMLDFRPNLRVPLVLSTVTICLLLSQVQAQTPPACAIQCGETAASQAGCDITDTSCCNNAAFQSAAGACVAMSCSPADAQAALTYFTNLCSGTGPSGPASSESAPPESGSPSATDSGSLPASPSESRTITFSGSATGSETGSGTPSSSGTATVTSPASSSHITSSPSSSSSSSGGSSSQPARSSSSTSSRSSTTSSNVAATATHAAVLLAGGLGALIAVVV